MTVLKVVYPELPPSSNKIYFHGTILRKEAREYAERFAYYFAQNHLHEASNLNPNALYALVMNFYFETVVNQTYNDPNVKASKRAKTRYKKFDLTNRIKLLEDCFRDAVGIDDSQTFVAFQGKYMDPNFPRVELFFYEVEPMQFGIPQEMLLR